MTQELWDLVNKVRAKGFDVTDENAEKILQHCYRKMEVAGIQNPDEYLPLLYEDELRNVLFRAAVNATSGFLNMVLEAV